MPAHLQLAHEAGDRLQGHAEFHDDVADGARGVQERLHDVAVQTAQALEPCERRPDQDTGAEARPATERAGAEEEIGQVEDVPDTDRRTPVV